MTAAELLAYNPQAAADLAAAAFIAGAQPDERLDIPTWSARYRILPAGLNSEPGPYDPERTPYLVEPAQKMSRGDPAELVAVIKGAQTGGTTGLVENTIGSIVAGAGGPVMAVYPVVDLAKKASKQRFQPMFEAAPDAFDGKIATGTTRDSSSTMLEKEFQGGHLVITGANSGAGLRFMAAQTLLLDEVDAYPLDVDGEGDPVTLAWKRTNTYRSRRKILMLSTPTVRGISRIEKAYLSTDQRVYFVPCPYCGELQPIEYKRITVPDRANPRAAYLACRGCSKEIAEHHKTWMLATANGAEWIPTAEPEDANRHGYHIPATLSPLGWYSWADAVADHRQAKREGRESLKAWVNTVLGETWDEEGEGADADALMARAETYPAECPEGTLLLTAGVDVQADRLEAEVVGWGRGEESWAVDYRIFLGDPNQPEVWQRLDELLAHRYQHEDGGTINLAGMCVDSGYLTQRVYDYVRPRQARRVFATKGKGGSDLPFVSAPRKTKAGRNPTPVPVFTLGVDSLKGLAYSRFKLLERGPGYCHWPRVERFGPEYFAQLTAERMVTRATRGVPRKVWTKIRDRNEALDCRVMAYACLVILDPLWDALERARLDQDDPTDQPAQQARRPRSSFATRYRRRR